MNHYFSWRRCYTLTRKECQRFLKVWLQTVLNPVVPGILYLAIFGTAFGEHLGIDENKQVEASLKPNPVKKGEPFNIEVLGKINNITLYNTSGRLIKTIHPGNRKNALIQTTDLKRGLYLLKIATENKRVGTCKLLVN